MSTHHHPWGDEEAECACDVSPPHSPVVPRHLPHDLVTPLVQLRPGGRGLIRV